MEFITLREYTVSYNTKNIVLVHGAWADGSSWSEEIPILKNAGYQVIAVQLAEHSLADDPDPENLYSTILLPLFNILITYY
jgi:pimeloyl-ACP methyl ester carboxylesterase